MKILKIMANLLKEQPYRYSLIAEKYEQDVKQEINNDILPYPKG